MMICTLKTRRIAAVFARGGDHADAGRLHRIGLRACCPSSHRAERVDGLRRRHRGAVRTPTVALRLLHPAVRPGDQPAPRRHPRGAGDLVASTLGPERNLLEPTAASCRQIVLPMPVISNDDLAKLLYINEDGKTPGYRAFAVDGLFEVSRGGEGLRRRPSRTSASGSAWPSPTAPTSSCSPIGTPTPSTPPSRRCCWPRLSTTIWSGRRPAPRWGWSSRRATHARCTTWRCSRGSGRPPSTPTWPSRPSTT